MANCPFIKNPNANKNSIKRRKINLDKRKVYAIEKLNKNKTNGEGVTGCKRAHIDNIICTNSVNNLIVTSQFFNSIIKSCEFLIDSSNDDSDVENLKKVFFTVDPRTYLIDQNNLNKFFLEVKRNNANTKLKGLIHHLPLLETEVQYKSKYLQEDIKKKWMFEINYKMVDLINFIFAVFVITFLLIFLKVGSNLMEFGLLYYIIYSLIFLQTVFISIFLLIFYRSKYNFYVILERVKINKKKLTLIEQIKLNVIDSFIWNDETYIMISNLIIGLLSLISKKYIFLYILQLFTVIKFVDTVREIGLAFKSRFFQLLSMVGFLAILINAYTFIGFFFLLNEFDMTLGDGTTENVCASLFSCYITFFNYGIRSGGGIGDILSSVSSSNMGLFLMRYFFDFIFWIIVIVLVLNMVNGIIITTFSSIREESEQRREDINNKCFICSIPKVEFEKKKINFEDHIQNEHNPLTYIRYLVGLKLIDKKDLDSDQSYILHSVKNMKIRFFPIGKSVRLGDVQLEEEDDD
jgi:hypothetical protein